MRAASGDWPRELRRWLLWSALLKLVMLTALWWLFFREGAS
jgi:hypothetical protein